MGYHLFHIYSAEPSTCPSFDCAVSIEEIMLADVTTTQSVYGSEIVATLLTVSRFTFSPTMQLTVC